MRRESLLLRVFLAICIGAFAAAEEGHGTCSEASACAGSTEVALVTGANVGLGMHTALQLAAKGVFVYASMRNVATGGMCAWGSVVILYSDPNPFGCRRVHNLDLDQPQMS